MTLGCVHGDMSVVSGDIYSKDYPVYYIFTQYKKEPADIGRGYWCGKDGHRSTFILNLGCVLSFDGIQLVNTHNKWDKDRSTKKFRYLPMYIIFLI